MPDATQLHVLLWRYPGQESWQIEGIYSDRKTAREARARFVEVLRNRNAETAIAALQWVTVG